jgi:hypothetical protein
MRNGDEHRGFVRQEGGHGHLEVPRGRALCGRRVPRRDGEPGHRSEELKRRWLCAILYFGEVPPGQSSVQVLSLNLCSIDARGTPRKSEFKDVSKSTSILEFAFQGAQQHRVSKEHTSSLRFFF